ncbi:MAG: hypothetical protein AAFQ36_03240 [Pseudomonadota bacterium]
MPHDHPHDHAHDHSHDHNHNHRDPYHLHSHMEAADYAAELQVLTTQFIEGFCAASDKAAYLRIAGIPNEIDDPDGGPKMKLVDIKLTTEWQVGTASPGFGSRELSYLPFPGEMISERTNMGFIYVSIDRQIVTDLKAFLTAKGA